MTQSSEAHLPSLLDAFCRSLRCLQSECGLTDTLLIAAFCLLRSTTLLHTLTCITPCWCLYFQCFFTITLGDSTVIKICRAVCNTQLFLHLQCLFIFFLFLRVSSCCTSLFFFFFLILGKRSVKKVSHVPCARSSQAHSAFLSGVLSQESAFAWKCITSIAGSASSEWRSC